MVKDMRVTYRRQTPYNTKSNKVRCVKTPGGKLLLHNVRKSAAPVRCGDTGKALQGIARQRPAVFQRLPKFRRTVARAYGGSRSADAVRERILRAFIVEEQKIVKQVVAQQSKASKKTKKASSKAAKGKKNSRK